MKHALRSSEKHSFLPPQRSTKQRHSIKRERDKSAEGPFQHRNWGKQETRSMREKPRPRAPQCRKEIAGRKQMGPFSRADCPDQIYKLGAVLSWDFARVSSSRKRQEDEEEWQKPGTEDTWKICRGEPKLSHLEWNTLCTVQTYCDSINRKLNKFHTF